MDLFWLLLAAGLFAGAFGLIYFLSIFHQEN